MVIRSALDNVRLEAIRWTVKRCFFANIDGEEN